MPDYVIGSGWWCDDSQGATARAWTFGDDLIRSAGFFDLWYQSVRAFCEPRRIVVVDSSSPIPPDRAGRDDVEVISLTHNPGHAVDGRERLCGYTQSVMLSAYYAYLAEVDYFVYVEQDNLLFGEGIVERVIDAMTTPYAFGAPVPSRQPLQQSFFVVRRDGLLPLLGFLQRVTASDQTLCPEKKFALAAFSAARGPLGTAAGEALRRHLAALDRLTISPDALPVAERGYDFLPFGSGRNRPIDFDAPHYYFQHGTRAEVERYLEQTGFTL